MIPISDVQLALSCACVSMPDRWPHASTRSRTCRAGPPAHAFTQTRKQKRRDDSSLLCVVPCDAAFGTGSSGRPDDVPPTSVPGCAASTRWIIQRTHAALPSPLQGSPAWTPAGAHPPVRSTCPPPVLTKQPPRAPVTPPRTTRPAGPSKPVSGKRPPQSTRSHPRACSFSFHVCAATLRSFVM